MAATIFLSCGQSHFWPDEKKTATKLHDELTKLGFKVFVATAESTLQNPNAELLETLKIADYYLFVDFKRELVINCKNNTNTYRGSLYTHQELGMAYALGFDSTNMLLFSQKEVEPSGLKGYMVSNCAQFHTYDDAVRIITQTVQNEWLIDYSRKLHVKDADLNPTYLPWTDI